jgi:hypothetical protein
VEVRSAAAESSSRATELELPAEAASPIEAGTELQDQRQAVLPPIDSKGFTFDPARRIRGVVIFPPGTPEDEVCELILRASPRRYEHAIAGWRFDPPEPELLELVRRTVADGVEFELPLPSDAGRIQLDVAGHYLYLDGGVMLDESERLVPVEVRPQLGGWVTLKLVVPPGFGAPPLGADFAAAALRESEVRLTQERANPWVLGNLPPRTHTAHFDKQLKAELYAVTPGVALSVPLVQTLGRGAPEIAPFAVPLGWSVVVAAGQHLEAEVRLVEATRISGVVVDERDRIVPNVAMDLRYRDGTNRWHASLMADPNGHFELLGLPGKPDSLLIERRNFETKRVERVDLGIDMRVVLHKAPKLAGTVRLPDGRPVIGLRVEAKETNAKDEGGSRWAFTDGAGYFEFSGLGEIPYDLSATAQMGSRASAKIVDETSAATVWRLDAPGLVPTRDGELALEMVPGP